MSEKPKLLLGKQIDRTALRKSVVELAARFGSKVMQNRKTVLGENCAPYKIPLHTEEFYCFVLPSEATYRFTAECRKQKGEVADFAVNLMVQVGYTEYCPSISESLGVPVYGNKLFTEADIAARFLTPKLGGLLHRIDFAPISHFLLSPIQFHVCSAFQGIEQCADQSRLFRDLITSTYREAFERNKDRVVDGSPGID